MDLNEFSIACKLINLKVNDDFDVPKRLPWSLLASLPQSGLPHRSIRSTIDFASTLPSLPLIGAVTPVNVAPINGSPGEVAPVFEAPVNLYHAIKTSINMSPFNVAPVNGSSVDVAPVTEAPLNLYHVIETSFNMSPTFNVEPVSVAPVNVAPVSGVKVNSMEASFNVSPVKVKPFSVTPVNLAAPVNEVRLNVAHVNKVPQDAAHVDVAPFMEPANVVAPVNVAHIKEASFNMDSVKVAPVYVRPVKEEPTNIAHDPVAPFNVAQVSTAPVNVAPVIVAPVNVAPVNVAHVNVAPVNMMSAGPSVENVTKVTWVELDWAVPYSTKKKYMTMFNRVDRTRSGFLSRTQAWDVMVQTKLPQNTLRKIWALSDLDCDERLGFEEFVLAMHLCQQASLGIPPSVNLPANLIPPYFRTLQVLGN